MLRISLAFIFASLLPVSASAQAPSCPNAAEAARGTDYPNAALKDGLTSGKAVVEFVVQTDGTVTDAHVISSTHDGFGDAALAVVAKLRCDARESPKKTNLPVHFTMPTTPCDSSCSKQCGLSKVLGELGYPRAAEKLGMDRGDAVVEFTLWPNGRISGMTTIESSDYIFDAHLRTALLNAAPEVCPGANTPIRLRLPVSFALQ